jgi:hypothetical protein
LYGDCLIGLNKTRGGAGGLRASIPKFCLSIAETCYATGFGRTPIYDLIAQKKLRAVKAGGRTLPLADGLQEYLNSLEEVA